MPILRELIIKSDNLLQARAVRRVAAETVATRTLLRDQVKVLADNRLKSELDVTFAESALAEARVLVSRAENEEPSALARLASLLGERGNRAFSLEDVPPPAPLRENVENLTVTALANRPELLRLRLAARAAEELAHAERVLHYPVISAIGVGGVIPERNPRLPENYLAAGVNVSIPLFNGFQIEARRKAALLKAKAARESTREEEENVIRELRIAFLNAQNADERVTLTKQFVETASRAFDLADAKYKAGTSSLAEMAQAQLSKTTAEIAHASAPYDLLIQRAALDFQANSCGFTDRADSPRPASSGLETH